MSQTEETVLSTVPVAQWTKHQVFDYLNGLEIGGFSFSAQDVAEFPREAITGPLLLKLEKDDLNTLGIDQFRKRNALYDHIQALKSGTIQVADVDTKEIISGNMTGTDDVMHQENGQQIESPVPSTVPLPNPSMHGRGHSAFGLPTFSTNSTMSNNFVMEPNSGVFREIEQELASEAVNGMPVQSRSLSAPPNLNHEFMNFTEIRRVRDQNHLVDFPAIYQGANLHSRMFALMTQRHIAALNEIYGEMDEIKSDSNGYSASVRPQRSISEPHQDFECQVPATKVPFAWRVGSGNKAVKLPFNALVRCRLDLRTNAVVDVQPIFVSGAVDTVNDHGKVWVMGDVQVKVTEFSTSSNMVSNIISLELINLSNTSVLHRRGCSYMIHDPEDQGGRVQRTLRKGTRVDFCLKVSTRSNAKDKRGIKPCFIQAWDPRVVQ